MAKNEGKKFEEDFQKSVPEEWFCYRLKDSSGGWSNSGVSRFTPKNSCDFIVFTGYGLFLIECKSIQGKSLPFSNIREKQLADLVDIDLSMPLSAHGVFCINFRDLSETYLIHASVVNKFKIQGTRKSLSIENVRANGVLIPQKLKRTRYRYDLSALIEVILLK